MWMDGGDVGVPGEAAVEEEALDGWQARPKTSKRVSSPFYLCYGYFPG